MTVWVFPGVGSQRVGMAAGLRDAATLLDLASSLCGEDLAQICAQDQPDTQWPLRLIQPSLFAVCTVIARARLTYGSPPDAVIGHSLGEFAALVATDSLTFEDALRLVIVRGNAMADLSEGSAGMMAVLGLDAPSVRDVCEEVREEGHFVAVANFNSPSQTVLAGSVTGLAEAAARCRDRGAMRVRMLRVPYPAHSSRMAAAGAQLKRALQDVPIAAPRVPFYNGVTGQAVTDPPAIRSLLSEAVTSPVRFVNCVEAAARDGHRSFLELGPGSPPRLLGLIGEILATVEIDLALVSNDDEAQKPCPFAPRAMHPPGSVQ
jgi:[acyl-carrier-protein] S-malonyltransferase